MPRWSTASCAASVASDGAGLKRCGAVYSFTRATFADVAQTLAEVFGVGPLTHGTSFLAGMVRI